MEQQPRRLERLHTVKSRVGLGRTSIYEKIREGNFPKPIHIGARAVAWDSEAIDSWIEAKINQGEKI